MFFWKVCSRTIIEKLWNRVPRWSVLAFKTMVRFVMKGMDELWYFNVVMNYQWTNFMLLLFKLTTLFFAFSVVLHLMLLLLILPTTLSTNHSKHVETSYIVLKLTFSVHNISWHLVLQFVISVANTKCKKQCRD
jgi:hypothetical protein